MPTPNSNLNDAAQTIDLHGLEQKTRQHQALIDSSNAKIQQLTADASANIDAMVEAAFKSATTRDGETVLSLQARQLGELQAQEFRADLMHSLGEDREASARLSNQLASQIRADLEASVDLQQRVTARKQVGFFDNPLEFLWNQLQLPDEENALNAHLTSATNAQNQLERINKLESDTARASELMSSKLSIAGQESKVEALKSLATLQAGEIRAKGIQQNVQNLEIMVAADQKTLDNYHQILAARNQQAHLALSIEANGRAREQFAQWKKEVADTEAGQQQQLDWINAGAKLVGKPAFDHRQLLTLIKSSKGQLPQELQVLMERGYTAAATGNTVQWGDTPTSAAEVAYVTKQASPAWLNEQFAEAQKILNANAMMPGAKKLTPQERDSQINQIVAERMAKYSKVIDSRDTTNPYLIPTTADVARNPTVQASPLFSKVLAPQKVDTRDINIVIARGLEAVKTGQISFRDLDAGLDTYIKAGIGINNEMQMFERYATKPGLGYNYTSQVRMNKSLLKSAETAGLFSGLGTETVDLLDAGKRREYLVKRYQSSISPTPESQLFK